MSQLDLKDAIQEIRKGLATADDISNLNKKLEGLKEDLKGEIHGLMVRMDDLERTDHIVRLAPRMPEPERYTHRAIRANSVSGPRYR